MWLAITLGACGDADEPEQHTHAGDDDTTTESVSCATATIGAAGGSVSDDLVIVTVPADAFAADVEVELCTDGVVDGFAPVSLVAELSAAVEPSVPFTIELPYSTSTATGLALWAEDADGDLVRQLRAADSGTAFAAPLYRTGTVFVAADPRILESYVGPANNTADLLFVVDNSCGMELEQVQLSNSFAAVFAELQTLGLDYHVGVTSTDLDGNYNGSQGKLVNAAGYAWLDPSTPNPEDVFQEMVSLGGTGSGVEKGIGASFHALDTLANSANAGFQRVDAQLAVVVVSDEPDYTPASEIPPAGYVTWFDALKADPATSWFNAVIDAEFGARYSDITAAVGGDAINIASADWTPFLREVIDRFEVTTYVLATDADPDSVEVWVVPADGTEPYPLDAASFQFDDATNELTILAGGWGELDEVLILYAAE